MDGLILLALFVGLFIVMPLLIGALRRTGWFWLPAVILFGIGGLSMMSIEPAGHGIESAWSGLGNALAYLFGLTMYGYGAVALLIGGVSFTRQQRRERQARAKLEPQPLPVATVVSG